MPITINGNGTISGLSVGGLPSGSVTSTTLATSAKPLFSSFAILEHYEAHGGNGQAISTADTWTDKTLTRIYTDPDSIVSLSSNQFTLQAGSYLINAISSAYKIHNTVLKLYNITDSSDTAFGMTGYIPNTTSNQTNIHLTTRFTISGAKVFELQQAGAGTENTYGMGVNHSFGSEIYTIIEIYKES